MSRVKVFFTVDVEIWPGGWTNIDERFAEAFQRYVYGPTPFGQYGLPMTLELLADHGLTGVFFVEPMFSARYGLAPLAEVVGLIKARQQDVQMHLHTEWVNEARTPVLAQALEHKVQHLSQFPPAQQAELIAWSKRRLLEAGAAAVSAFRAGSFAFNRDSLRALEASDVRIDSSYNHCHGGAGAGVTQSLAGAVPLQPFAVGSILEFPVTVFRDRPFHLRPLHVTACSLPEMVAVLNKASDQGHFSVVIVSHNFELLDRRTFARDETVARRLRGLFRFLSRNGDRFETGAFPNGVGAWPGPQPATLSGNPLALGLRYAEQLVRGLRSPAS